MKARRLHDCIGCTCLPCAACSFRRVRQGTIIADAYRGYANREKEALRKRLLTFIERTTATLLIALAIGLGIAVHSVFFLAALLMAIAAAHSKFR